MLFRNASLRDKRASGSIADDAPHNALRAGWGMARENRQLGSLPVEIRIGRRVARMNWLHAANDRQTGYTLRAEYIN